LVALIHAVSLFTDLLDQDIAFFLELFGFVEQPEDSQLYPDTLRQETREPFYLVQAFIEIVLYPSVHAS